MTPSPALPRRGAPTALRVLCALLALAAPAAAQGTPPLGTEPLSVKTAAKLYEAVCLDTAPGFSGAPAALTANGFAPNPETGTFYHPRLDLSFHVDHRCSMVFASDEAAPLLGMAFAAATNALGGTGAIDMDPASGFAGADGPGGTRLSFGPLDSPPGSTYFRALLQPAS